MVASSSNGIEYWDKPYTESILGLSILSWILSPSKSRYVEALEAVERRRRVIRQLQSAERRQLIGRTSCDLSVIGALWYLRMGV